MRVETLALVFINAMHAPVSSRHLNSAPGCHCLSRASTEWLEALLLGTWIGTSDALRAVHLEVRWVGAEE